MKIKSKPKDLKEEHIILPDVIHDRAATHPISDNNFCFGEERQFKENPVASKFSFDLFDEKVATIQHPVVRVKHISNDSSEKWRIYHNSKNTFTLEGVKLSRKEKEFLRTVEGVRFLLDRGKDEELTLLQLKRDMKPKLSRKLSAKPKKS